MISIIDYGVGNLHSISKSIENLGYKVAITNNPDKILASDRIVLPGVGAFEPAMKSLDDNSLIEVISEFARKGNPVLGICLGLQLFFAYSEEGGRIKGLNIVAGKVTKIRTSLKLPQIGWNTINKTGNCKLLAKIPDNSYFYFVHSYRVVPDNKKDIAAKTKYGTEFVSIIQHENITGTQFHPEKSSKYGLQLLKNWIKLC